MNNAPGKGLLKVSSIILIILAGLSLVGVLFLGGISAVAVARGSMVGPLGFLMTGAILISAGWNLFAGILGIKNCDKPEKAQVCFAIGVIMVVLAVLGLLASAINSALTWWGAVLDLILPVLYLVGALQNKSASETGIEGGSVIDQDNDTQKDTE